LQIHTRVFSKSGACESARRDSLPRSGLVLPNLAARRYGLTPIGLRVRFAIVKIGTCAAVRRSMTEM
jgi:hypothetical protein